jgi:hypothetical protein
MSVLQSNGPELLRDISKPSESKKGFIGEACRFATAALVPVVLSGCMGSGLGLSSMAPATDKSLTTGAIEQNARVQPDADETTVRNAVSSADLSTPGPVAIPWANTSTGSAGVINAITEENNGSYVCRTFMTSRHSYRGISNYGGKACLVGNGEWKLISFQEIG